MVIRLQGNGGCSTSISIYSFRLWSGLGKLYFNPFYFLGGVEDSILGKEHTEVATFPSLPPILLVHRFHNFYNAREDQRV